MKRGGWLARRTPLKARPATPSADEQQARRLVSERSGGVCEGCGQARATDWHHRLARSQGGKWAAENGLHLCRQCHRDVTSPDGTRREYARHTGMLVLSHEDPWNVPVTTPRLVALYGGPVHLGADGGVWPADLTPIDTDPGDWWPDDDQEGSRP